MNIFLLMMGGSGTRFGADKPKQYIEIDHKPIFSYIVERCNSLAEIDKIVIVSHPVWIEYVKKWIQKRNINKCAAIVSGGSNRSESVKNGLTAISEFASPDDVVMIHDATHPYLNNNDVHSLIEAVKKYGAATLAQPQYDTVYMTDDNHMLSKVIPREHVVSGASPEAFLFKKISEIYFKASREELARMTSAGAIALKNGLSMQVVPMTGINLKITYPQDMELFQKLVHTYFFPEVNTNE